MNKLFKTSSGDLRWGWKAVTLLLGSLLFGILLNTVWMAVLSIVYSAQGLAREQAMAEAAVSASSFLVQVVLSVCQLAFMLWLVYWLVTKVEKQKFEWSKLGLIPLDRSKYVLLGTILAIVLSVLTVGMGVLAGTLEFLGNGFDLFGLSQMMVTILFAAVLSLASGFSEEIAFRGYLQTRVAQRYGTTVAIVIVAVLFALLHPLGNALNPLLYFLTAVLVGILFGTVFVRSGSLWMGIALHTVWNYLQIAILAIRNSSDERYFGAPVFVFNNVSGISQMLIEIGVILCVLLFVLWLLKPMTMARVPLPEAN